jgi:hypothetical protein
VLRRRSLCATCMLDDDRRTDRKDNGANFQITVDCKTQSYRDTRETALEAGMLLRKREPASEVVVRDVRNEARTVIGWRNGSALSCQWVVQEDRMRRRPDHQGGIGGDDLAIGAVTFPAAERRPTLRRQC